MRRACEQRLRTLSTASVDDRNRDGVSRLVTEGDAQPERQQQREDEYPKHYLRLALQFEHARHQQMAIAGPSAVAARRPLRGFRYFNRRFLDNAHPTIPLPTLRLPMIALLRFRPPSIQEFQQHFRSHSPRVFKLAILLADQQFP